MNVPQETLDAWPRACERLRGVMQETRNYLLAGDIGAALELVEFAYVAVLFLGNEMQQMGAARPATLPLPPEIPLRLLSSQANRQFAQALRKAYEAGTMVDWERGWEDTGPAQILKMMLFDVETQVFGAQGLDKDA
jgi:hypothetical protein